MKTLEERFWSKVAKSDGCWLWKDRIDWTGYGKIRIGGRAGRPHQAHRVSYELAKGAIPAGAQRDKKWRAYVNHNGKYRSAGYHATRDAAAQAALTLRLELFTHNELDKDATQTRGAR